MKRCSFAFLIFVFLASAGYAPSAQRERGAINITGWVSATVQLSVRKGWQASNQQAGDMNFSADSAGSNTVQIALSGEKTAVSEVVVPLELRTNKGYELKLTLISSEGPAPAMLASIGSLRPSGPLVSPGAVQATRDLDGIELEDCLSPVTALRGPRVSMRGNFKTPTNALLADLKLAISPAGATPGRWRSVFRVSLHPSL